MAPATFFPRPCSFWAAATFCYSSASVQGPFRSALWNEFSPRAWEFFLFTVTFHYKWDPTSPPPKRQQNEQNQIFMKRLVFSVPQRSSMYPLLTLKCVVKSVTQTGPGNVCSARILCRTASPRTLSSRDATPHICCFVSLELLMRVCLLMKMSFFGGRARLLSSSLSLRYRRCAEAGV